MSFLDEYLNDNNLPPLPDHIKERLDEIEKKINDLFPSGNDQYANLIKEYYPKIVEIVDKIKNEFKDWEMSAGNVVSAFRFIITISNEISEIVNEFVEKVIPVGTPAEEAHQIKIELGRELTWFAYCLWNPRIIKHLPEVVETWIEKRIIYWLSGMVVDWALDYFGSGQAQAKIQRLTKNGKK